MNELLKTVLAEANARAHALKEARSGDAHFSPKGDGGFGHMLTLDDTNPMIAAIARVCKIPDGWKLTKIGDMWAAYNSGDRLTFFANESDFEADEE
jgi:hypothetical protein